MMKIKLKKIFENYHVIALLGFFCLMFIFHQNLYLRRPDDDFYNVIAKCGFEKILEFLKWHYKFKNGRIWLNFFEILTLKFDVYLWRIINPVMFTVMAYFTGRLVTPFFQDKRKAIIAAVGFYLIVDYSYVSSGVFWLSSSFNYLIPMLAFILAIFFYTRNFYLAALPFVILAGFATEQSSMVTIGFFVLNIIDKVFLKKEKQVIKEVIFTVIAIVGLCTIVFAPATSLRMGMYAVEPSIISCISRFNDILYMNWLGSGKSISIIVLLTASVSIPILKADYKSKSIKYFSLALTALLIVFCVANLVNIIYFGSRIALFYYAFLALFILSVLYSSIVLVIERKTLPVIMLILGVGSQVMMSITDNWVFRTCFPGIVCFSVYILIIFGYYMQAIRDKRKILIVVLSLALVLTLRNVYGDIGYIKENDTGIESFCENEATSEDYNYVLTDAADGTFWYEGDHEKFFEGKIKYSNN